VVAHLAACSAPLGDLLDRQALDEEPTADLGPLLHPDHDPLLARRPSPSQAFARRVRAPARGRLSTGAPWALGAARPGCWFVGDLAQASRSPLRVAPSVALCAWGSAGSGRDPGSGARFRGPPGTHGSNLPIASCWPLGASVRFGEPGSHAAFLGEAPARLSELRPVSAGLVARLLPRCPVGSGPGGQGRDPRPPGAARLSRRAGSSSRPGRHPTERDADRQSKRGSVCRPTT
jgi:hypothetical protein